MISIVNTDIPEEAKRILHMYGDVINISSNGITYDAVSGHPDVFLCEIATGEFVVAPNTPNDILKNMEGNSITISQGIKNVGYKYPQSAHYNAVVTENFIIHNLDITDEKVRDFCISKDHIHVNQGYTRCNLLALKNDNFITSDKGIFDSLKSKGLNCLYVKPEGIVLPGYDNGFIGGTAGIYNNTVYFIGNLDFFASGNSIRTFLVETGYNIIELYNGPLYDGGSILFVK